MRSQWSNAGENRICREMARENVLQQPPRLHFLLERSSVTTFHRLTPPLQAGAYIYNISIWVKHLKQKSNFFLAFRRVWFYYLNFNQVCYKIDSMPNILLKKFFIKKVLTIEKNYSQPIFRSSLLHSLATGTGQVYVASRVSSLDTSWCTVVDAAGKIFIFKIPPSPPFLPQTISSHLTFNNELTKSPSQLFASDRLLKLFISLMVYI